MRIPLLQFCKTQPSAITPAIGTPGSAGIDMYNPLDIEITIQPGGYAKIGLGLKAKFPVGYALVAFNRSSVALQGLVVGACVVDSDYRGEIHLHLINVSNNPVTVFPSQKLVQFLLLPVCPEFTMVDDIPEDTTRGKGGFGSTGK